MVRMMSACGTKGVGAAEGGRTDDDVVLVVFAALPRPSPSEALDDVVCPSASVTARRMAASASMSARRGTTTTMAGREKTFVRCERGCAQQVSCLQWGGGGGKGRWGLQQAEAWMCDADWKEEEEEGEDDGLEGGMSEERERRGSVCFSSSTKPRCGPEHLP